MLNTEAGHLNFKPEDFEPGSRGLELDGARIYRFGETAIVLDIINIAATHRLATQAKIYALDHALRLALQNHATTAPAPGVGMDIVPGDCNLSIFFNPETLSATRICQLMMSCWQHASGAQARDQGTIHNLQVSYGGRSGPDLEPLARQLSLQPEALVERHMQAEYRVAFLGFQPGFAYLHGLHATLQAPRRQTPRQRIPANSLAIGGPYTAIYPAATPGGWHIIGSYQPGSLLFDPARDTPSLLRAGDRVRFERSC
ncbi:MAG: 5-oxoprolinase subunit PxpB [Gammaproteobacteria bacterium]|nr:5-oxoprolinase subunit PxpB [Gammaproteobacteria bacterium]NND39390.1 5-oxoprolinase subunit PxpB [Pseudomonadales bacterium]NNM11351.1 5-oxoprolinase subunit PxpB [Pseudomonadales bacterium]